MITHCM